MYCIKCGVELADSEKVCPLCGTRVFHPDLPCGSGECRSRSAVVATHDRKLGKDRNNQTIGLYTQTNKKKLGHLRVRLELVAKAGIEPATHGFSVRCSTN